MLLISTAPTAPGHLRLHVDGELDIFAAQDLRRALSTATGQAVTSIEVDLSGVEFVDASALGVLIRAWRDIALAGAVVRVTGASAVFSRTTARAGLSAAFAA
ncbi:STAS domain-containing protein [Nocardioides sp. Leaf307]|uniref:STAS domain-containing protein n=1 Tax=Nocardioides sp. Leaf307 TaxID=1736331 RepID=UPI0007034919|nr:STAS domain-containing protein [Nocardioides sp. Leaf307]KQQ42959.1 hypothetical protein ASF50_02795 [Nocardioides sp. Leaf307]